MMVGLILYNSFHPADEQVRHASQAPSTHKMMDNYRHQMAARYATLTTDEADRSVLAAMTLGFEFYFHIAGRKYDGLLGQYRKEHERE
jgi:hypothetical protein